MIWNCQEVGYTTSKHSTFSGLWACPGSILSRGSSSLCGSETHDCFYALLSSSLSHSQYLWPTLRIHFAKHRKGSISYVKNNTKFPSMSSLPGLQPTFSLHQWLCFINCSSNRCTKPVGIPRVTGANQPNSLPMSITNGAFPEAGVQADAALGAHAVAAPVAHGASVHQQPQGLLAASTASLLVLLPGAFCPLPPKLLQLQFHFPNSTDKKENKSQRTKPHIKHKLIKILWLCNTISSGRYALKCDLCWALFENMHTQHCCSMTMYVTRTVHTNRETV